MHKPTQKKELLGNLSIDSGLMLITDPANIDNQWEKKLPVRKGEGDTSNPEQQALIGDYSYGGCAATTKNKKHGGELLYRNGPGQQTNGAGVVATNLSGDASYNVFGIYEWREPVEKDGLTRPGAWEMVSMSIELDRAEEE